jgi:hypothetical protein
MTVLSAIQKASTKIALTVPTVVYSSTDREHLELQELANECASYIAKDYEWQALKTLATITGDGTDETFALPTDYDRMLKKAQLWSSRYQTPLTHITDTDHWLELDIRQFETVIGVWTLIANEVNIKPAPALAETVNYYYMTNKWAQATGGGTLKTAFDTDTDVFRLSEDLLKLCMIWKWKAAKKLPYAQEQSDYEDAKEKMISNDKGSRILRVGRARMPRGTRLAYPVPIIP